MRSPLFLPVSWFLDYEPPWLGTAVMVLGVVLVALSYIRTVSVQKPATYYVVGFPLAGIGVAPWVLTYPEPFIVALSFTGNWLQGVGIVRGYLKIRSYFGKAKNFFFRDRDGDGGGIPGFVQKVGVFVLFQLAGLLAVVLSVWVGFGLVTYEVLTIPSLTTDIVITWTLITLFGGILGLLWRFWTIRDTLPTMLIFGLILVAAGAELHNFRTLQSDLLVFFLNKTVLALGFIAAVAVLILKSRTDSGSDAEWRDQV